MRVATSRFRKQMISDPTVRMPLPRALFKSSPRIFVATGISIATLIVSGAFLLQTELQRTDSAKLFSLGVAYLPKPAGTVAKAASVEKDPMREVHIANNGLMLLRGATVLSHSQGTIRVSMEWDTSDFIWLIRTDNETTYVRGDGEKGASVLITAGDIITVSGMLVKGGLEPTIMALSVRE